MTQTIENQVLSRIYGKGMGNVFTPKDFLDLGSHVTVRQILSRLVSSGKIRRLMRGVYDYPEHSRLLNRPAGPNPDAVAHAIARAHGWTILPSGNTALNFLGLSTQVPAQWEYFTDGPTKRYEWDSGRVAFKHRTNKETTILSPTTAMIVQALKTLGEDRVDEDVLETLRSRLGGREINQAKREARYATSWVYEIIKRLAKDKGRQDA